MCYTTFGKPYIIHTLFPAIIILLKDLRQEGAIYNRRMDLNRIGFCNQKACKSYDHRQ